ncbi:MAG: dihydropteroate synthase [Veillonellaceae bacterium]|nr:dihydropteroate synthase [Veillonellaceae bacterium]
MNYQARVVRLSGTEEATAWLRRMNCDPSGVAIMAPKAIFRTVCVESVPTKAANLLKQTFLAKGAEVAVARGTADLSAEYTDVLICGTLKHYRLALAQLRQQPWGLPDLAKAVEQALANDSRSLSNHYQVHNCHWTVQSRRTLVMGILNLTPDSFSDGGQHNQLDQAVARARQMVDEGADILDVGAESTRPYGATPISAQEEMDRLLPALEKILAAVNIPVSIDTYKSEVAEQALRIGAHMLNDIWGLQREPVMAELAVKYDVPVVVMHNRQSAESTQDIMGELTKFFRDSLRIGRAAGMQETQFILDPGIGFGKTTMQNLEVLGRLAELRSLGFPILVGTSRKRFIGEVLGLPVEERDEGTGATVVHSILNGAAIVRMHDVKMAKRMAVMTDALQGWRIDANG